MRRFLLGTAITFGLLGCAGLLGDFAVSEGGPQPPGGGEGGVDANADGPADATSDAPVDGAVLPKDEVLAVATNQHATCATLAYGLGSPSEKRVSYCWGADGNNTPEFIGGAAGDPTFEGFQRPRIAGPPPLQFLVFDKLASAANGLWFQGRVAEGSPGGAAIPFVWGANDQAECGIPSGGAGPPPAVVPPTVIAPTTGALRVDAIGAGPYHGCFIAATRLYCWGQNNNCEVISGGSGACPPTFIRSVIDETTTVIDPAHTYEFDSFAGGYEHSCVIKRKVGQTSASVACWGKNSSNQCGQNQPPPDPPIAFVDDPSTVAGPGLVATFGNLEVSAGSYHTCAIMTHSDLYCWGQNDKKQAQPTTTANPAFAAKLILPNTFGSKLGGLALGGDISCFIATPDSGPEAGKGAAICFGDSAGPLGRDPTEVGLPFGRVKGIRDVRALSIGLAHACAIAQADGEPDDAPHGLFCWGANTGKQIDPNESQTTFALPHRVKFPAKPVD